jgi:hypothetical protein
LPYFFFVHLWSKLYMDISPSAWGSIL